MARLLFRLGFSHPPSGLKLLSTKLLGILQVRYIESIQEQCITIALVPTIHQILLSRASTNPTEFESVKFRFIRSCSSALAPAVFEQLEKT